MTGQSYECEAHVSTSDMEFYELLLLSRLILMQT